MGCFGKIWEWDWKRTTLLVLPLFLTDCASQQRVDPDASIYSSVPIEPTNNEELFTSGFWPTASWWEVFQDPCLSRCIEVALEKNPDLLEAQKRVEEAFAVAQREGGPRWFQIGADGSILMIHLSENGLYKALNPSLSNNAILLNLTGVLTYEVDIWGKNYERYEAAVNLFQASQAKKSFVTVEVSTRVAESYFILQSLLAQQEKLRAWVRSQKEILDLSEKLVRARILNRLELETIRQEVEGLEQDDVVLESAIEIQRHLLAILMGHGPDHPVYVGSHFIMPTTPFVMPTNLPLGLLQRRPDLAADIYHLRSLEREIKIARTLFYPDINIIANGGFEAFTGKNLLSANSFAGSLLPSFTLPLFTGFRLEGNLAARIKTYEAGIFEYNAHVLKAAKEVKDLVSQIEKVVGTIGLEQKILEQESVKFDLTSALLRNRMVNQIQWNREQNRLYERWIAIYNLYRERYQYHVQLIRAMGGGYVMEEAP